MKERLFSECGEAVGLTVRTLCGWPLQDLIRHFRDVELGGRVMSATTGSAPSAPDVMMWLEEMLGTKIVDGYGSTEAGMMLLDGKLQRRCGAGSKPLVFLKPRAVFPSSFLVWGRPKLHACRTGMMLLAGKLQRRCGGLFWCFPLPVFFALCVGGGPSCMHAGLACPGKGSLLAVILQASAGIPAWLVAARGPFKGSSRGTFKGSLQGAIFFIRHTFPGCC